MVIANSPTSTPNLPRVSVIIPHWNGIDVLSECLESLQSVTYPNLEIVVVDNASSDGSPDWVKQHHPEVVLIENQINGGYAGGCNLGAQKAAGEYLIFLNNDTVQQPGWIEPLIERFERDESIAAIQPKILNYYERDRFDYAGGSGGALDILAFPFARGRVFLHQETDTDQYNDARSVFWASGTACAVRKSTYKEAMGFDETFFAHMEEIDLCWRLHLMGYKIWVEPASVIYHKNAVSLPMQTYRKYYLNHRNSLVMLWANYKLPTAVYLFVLRLALEWIAFGYALVKRDWKHMRAIVASLGWVLFHPFYIWKKRRQVRGLRRKKDREIMSQMYRGSVVLVHYLMGRKTYREIVTRAD